MFSSSSNLTASDVGRDNNNSNISAKSGKGKFGSTLLSGRISKQQVMGKKMFGNKHGKHGKVLKVGKKFRGSGKGIMNSSVGATMKDNSIDPSPEEFDDMLNSSITNNPNKKKSMFSRKMFG